MVQVELLESSRVIFVSGKFTSRTWPFCRIVAQAMQARDTIEKRLEMCMVTKVKTLLLQPLTLETQARGRVFVK